MKMSSIYIYIFWLTTSKLLNMRHYYGFINRVTSKICFRQTICVSFLQVLTKVNCSTKLSGHWDYNMEHCVCEIFMTLFLY